VKRRTRSAPQLCDPAGPAPPAPTIDAVRPATGTSLAHWGSLHDAWQEATDASRRRPAAGKEPLPHGVLLAIAEHRVRTVPVLRHALAHDPRFRPRIDALQRHTRDVQGRNWDIPAGACGLSQPAGYEADFRRVVDEMRDQFDLA
jgi:hypothetical protein